MFPSCVMVLKLSKKVHFLQFCAGLASLLITSLLTTNLTSLFKSIKAIYICTSERFRYALSENGTVYCAMTYFFRNIRVWSRTIFLNFCWVNIFFDILIPNISWRVTPINHILFWKSVIRTFRCIFVNCFDWLRFLAEVSTKLQKK